MIDPPEESEYRWLQDSLRKSGDKRHPAAGSSAPFAFPCHGWASVETCLLVITIHSSLVAAFARMRVDRPAFWRMRLRCRNADEKTHPHSGECGYAPDFCGVATMQLNVRDLAQIFNVSENVVYRWISNDQLPAEEING